MPEGQVSPDNMDLRLELSFSRTLLATRRISVLCRNVLSALVTPSSVAAVELAIAEHCTNAAKHCPHTQERSPLRLELELTRDELRVQFIDGGIPYDPRKFVRPVVDPNDRDSLRTDGMGLALIHDTMDEVSFRHEKKVNTVTFVKRITRLDADTSNEHCEKAPSPGERGNSSQGPRTCSHESSCQ